MRVLKGRFAFVIFGLVLFLLPAAVSSEDIIGYVRDGQTHAPLSGVDVEIYGDDGGTLIVSVSTDDNGIYEAFDIPVGGLYITFSIAAYVDTFGDFTVPQSTEIYSLGTVLLAQESTGTGTIDGTIIDASTEDTPVPGADLTLFEGINQTTGTSTATIISDEDDGAYEFSDLTPGSYTILATKEGFSDAFINVVSIGDYTITFPISMSRTLTAGNIRIVLTWDENPVDIDSHLHTPEIEGASYEVYYASPGSQESPPYAQLDRDDVTSYGPETITISQLYSGTYRYAVEYFTGTGYLGGSGAEVKVYDDNGLYATFNVPPTAGSDPPQMGDEWIVFYINGSTGVITDSEITGTSSGRSTIKLEDKALCFIATAAYGSPVEPQVKVLRDFRDRFLLTNTAGETFVELYYTHSPPIADFISKHAGFRATMYVGLLPLVGFSWVALNLGLVPALVLAFIFLVLAGETITYVLGKMRLRRPGTLRIVFN